MGPNLRVDETTPTPRRTCRNTKEGKIVTAMSYILIYSTCITLIIIIIACMGTGVHVPQYRAIVVEHSLYQSSFHTPGIEQILLF